MFRLRPAPAPVDTRSCSVYAAYNADDVPIYVGISCDVDERWAQHEADKPWRAEIAWWRELARYETRAEAKAHESWLIREWCTRWNLDESPVESEVRARYAEMFPNWGGVRPARRVWPWPVRALWWAVKALLWVLWTLTTGTLKLVLVVVASLLGVRPRRRRRSGLARLMRG